MNQYEQRSGIDGREWPIWDGLNVAVTPEDRDRFLKRARWAGDAGQHGIADASFWQRFQDEFLSPIRRWCLERRDRVAACYVPFSEEHLTVFVVTRSETYDFTLSDELTDLEMRLFEKQWASDINQVPQGIDSHLDMFFDRAASIQVYVNSG